MPHTMSAFGRFFSASSLAATMPVESRTHLMWMSGFLLLERFLVGVQLLDFQGGVEG